MVGSMTSDTDGYSTIIMPGPVRFLPIAVEQSRTLSKHLEGTYLCWDIGPKALNFPHCT